MAKTKAEIQREYERRTKYAAKRKYTKDKTKRYVIEVNITTEKDIYEQMEAQDSKAGYIKALIRADIERGR